jgi:hypothetical protein
MRRAQVTGVEAKIVNEGVVREINARSRVPCRPPHEAL